MSEKLIEGLIETAGSGRRLADLLRDAGLPRVAEVLVDEVRFRCGAARNTTPVTIELTLTLDADRVDLMLLFAPGRPVEITPTLQEPVVLAVDYDVADLARELYGPLRERAAGVRSTRFPTTPPPAGAPPDWPAVMAAAPVAIHQLLAACSARRPDLDQLAVAHRCDKWAGMHWFTPHYERHFRDLRTEAVTLLEIGVGGYGHDDSGGGSLRMWKHYFHRGRILGLDLYDKSHVDQPRLHTLVGDQNDPDFLTRMAREHGPFDIVVDDGSHVNQHVRTSFTTLLPYVRPGGWYVVEDLWTSFCPGFGGAESATTGPDTSLGLVKSLVDGLQWQERAASDRPQPTAADRNVVGVHVYHNIAFIETGRNDEGGVPAFVPRSIDELVPPGDQPDQR